MSIRLAVVTDIHYSGLFSHQPAHSRQYDRRGSPQGILKKSYIEDF